MNNYSFHYIIDSKLLAYGCKQTGRDILDIFNEIAKILVARPKGKIYIAADLGSSAHRLGISPYYKGKRREQKEKQSEEEKAAHAVFGTEYLQVVELFKKLPVTVMDVNDTEADDIASILAYDLAKDPHNRIALVTRDQDYGHSVIDDKNVKLVSPYYSEPDLYSKDICQRYHVGSREEFTLKKVLEGDDGDSILHPKWMGKRAVEAIWESCIIHEEVTLDILRTEIHKWISEQTNPARYTVPHKYIEHSVASTIDEVIDVNYKLAATMMNVGELSEDQQEQYHAALERPNTECTLNPFDDGIVHFGRPIIFSEAARKVFNVGGL